MRKIINKALALYEAGEPVRQIIKKCNITTRILYAALASAGVKRRKAGKNSAVRNVKLRKIYDKGEHTYEQVGALVGLSTSAAFAAVNNKNATG